MQAPIRILFINKITSVYGAIGKDHPRFQLVDDPEQADIVMYEDHTPKEIRNTSEYKKYPQKCVTVSAADGPAFFLPGCYASNSKHWLTGKRTRTIPYIRMAREGPNIFIKPGGPGYRYLYAFRGGASSWVRKKLFKNKPVHDDVFIEESNHYVHWSIDQSYQDQKLALQKEYAGLLDESLFFICPRGAGSGSIRLFEVMQAGRVPVIISDGWIPVEGFDWDEFSVRIPEKDITKIDGIIRANKANAEVMRAKAKEIYDNHFAPGPDLDLLADALTFIQENRNETKERFIRFIFPVFEGAEHLRQWLYRTLKFIILKLFALTGRKFPYSLNRPIEEQLQKSE